MSRSIIGYGLMILGCAGSLKANLQHMEALSTTEVGYMTFTKAWKKEIWLNGLLTKSGYELRGRSTETSDGLAAIQAQLNNLGRKIKKVNEKVYAAQVGCEQCKGPHYTKDFPQKEEGKTLEEAYYTQFGGPLTRERI
ncbi:hypothetical protein Tco_1090639 [Tanacetum coccineum]|uniref:Uncharacterized protein n=1 Tax=Tanacetum coccineum TaxID=301880 RepID=A0ABQ5I516_9ASTR